MSKTKVYKRQEQVNGAIEGIEASSQQVLSDANVENILRQYTEIMDFIRPDQPSKCTWKVGADIKTTPHTVIPL